MTDRTFLPTQELTDLVLIHTIKSDVRVESDNDIQNIDFRQLIGGRIMGLLATLAHDAIEADEDAVRLSDGARLDIRMREQLGFFLSLASSSNQQPVFDLIHKELLQFTSVEELGRTWWTLRNVSGVLTLDVRKDQLPPPFPGLDQIPPEYWTVTE